MSSATSDSLISSLIALAEARDLPEAKQRDRTVAAQAALRAVAGATDPWLLVYDNADDMDIVRPFLPSGGRFVRVLITSRSADWPEWEKFDLDRMEPEEARQMLAEGLEGYRTEAAAALDAIAKRLDYWPLALTAAIGFLRVNKNTRVDEYLAAFDVKRAELLKLGGAYVDVNRPETLSIPAAIGLSTDKLDQDARDMLSVLSFLNPDDLWPEMLAEGAANEVRAPFDDSAFPDFLTRAGGDDAVIRGAMDRLAQFSLVAQKDGQWQMHRLLGEIWRAELEDAAAWGNAAARVVNSVAPIGIGSERNWAQYKRLTEQARALLRAKVRSAAAARLYHQIGGYLLHRGAQAGDVDIAQAAVDILKALEPNSQSLAASLNNLSLFQHQAGDYPAALATLQRVLDIKKELPDIGPHHPSYAVTLNNMAAAHLKMQNFDQAEPLYRQALAIVQTALGEAHPNTIMCLRNLGALYTGWAEHLPEREDLREKEGEFTTQALEGSQQALGPRHQDVAADHNNIAVMYDARGDLERAVEHMRKAAAIRVDVLGAGHDWTVKSVRDYLTLASQSDLPVKEALRKTAAELRAAHGRWGRDKLAELLGRYGIEGDLSPETLTALVQAIKTKMEEMRADGAPDEAIHWLAEEAQSAAFAADMDPALPDSFNAELAKVLQVLQAQG